MTSEGRVLSDGNRYTLCPDKGCTGTIRDNGSCTSGHCEAGRGLTPEKPKQKPCRFHPDARMMPVIEVIDRRTGRRQWVQFCTPCEMESKPTGRQEFAS